MPKRSKKSRSNKPDVKKPVQPNLRAESDGPPAWAAAVLLAIAIGVVYGRALDAPFVFDDDIGIIKNNSIVSLWPLVGTLEQRGPLNPEPELPVSARPLVNLTFAINYAFGGLNPAGYRAANVMIHFCSAMLLFAIVRRALRLQYFAGQFETTAGWLAMVVAMLWALHPLQTEAVVYVCQRTELMVALFYLATLYCSMRYWSALPLPLGEAGNQRRAGRATWLALAVSSCSCGMASKEIMVSAPLIVLLFERTFVAGSLGRALRRSLPLYVGLASTELLLLYLNIGAPRSESAGFRLGIPVIPWWFTQSQVLLTYLKLVVWPWPLLIHYEWPYLKTIAESWMYVVPVLLLGIATLLLLWRNHPLGFLMVFAFAILSPTSVVPILTEMAAERRMYLPLAAIVVLFCIGGFTLAGRSLRRRDSGQGTRVGFKASLVALLLAIAFGIVSANRADAYHNPLELWAQVLRYQPENHVAHQNMGYYLEGEGKAAEAIEHYGEAIRISPGSVQGRFNLSTLLINKGAYEEAVEELRKAVRLVPNDAAMRNNLATALFLSKRYDEAITAYRATLELDPNNWTIHRNLGITLEKAGQYQAAIESFENALRLDSSVIEIYLDMAKMYSLAGQPHKSTAMLQQGLERARAQGDAAVANKFTARLNSAP
jgi:tetratricopeptide (TPR) repeat protein